jgi:hypothetical protein
MQVICVYVAHPLPVYTVYTLCIHCVYVHCTLCVHCVYVAHPLPVATQATVAGPQPQHLFNQMGPNQPTGVGCAYCTRKPCMLFTHALNGCVQCDMYNGAKFCRTQTAHSFPLCLQLHWCMYQPLCRLVSFFGYSLHACISTVFLMSIAGQQIARVLHSVSQP